MLMRSFVTAGIVIAIASGCSGGSDAPLIERNGGGVRPPPEMAPPSAPSSPPKPPADQGPDAACPSMRDPALAELGDIASVRTMLVGTYRACIAAGMNLEIRLDPTNESRLVFRMLDERFVSNGFTGSIELLECGNGSCETSWVSDNGGYASGERTVRIWSEPTAISVYDGSYLANEWVRIAD